MSGKTSHIWLWALFGVITLIGVGAFGVSATHGGPGAQLLLIGQTTSGHHQMELACKTCHTSWFGGREAIEEGCRSCHLEDLKEDNDNHPAIKFRDPRNADRLKKIDVTKCLTCHVEHDADRTHEMGVTLPSDFCVACHQDIGEERKTHAGLEFTTCASGGCHNYHDNRALYEDFLEKHIGEPDVFAEPQSAVVTYLASVSVEKKYSPATTHDAPPAFSSAVEINEHWLGSMHAQAGVNCSSCHEPKEAPAWIEKPGAAQCATCHANEAQSFTKGKHGMRLADGMLWEREGLLTRDRPLSPMRPELARIPMHEDAFGTELTCSTCHDPHSVNVQKAAVEACASCHADPHTESYFESSHHALWQAEQAGDAPAGSGVSCATCHMPRELHKTEFGEEFVFVQHNQNHNLRPNEKMGRNVCMNCHGLSFAIDALADDDLIARNFNGRPSRHIEGIDWVAERKRQRESEED